MCDAFHKLPVTKRKEIITKSGRCYCCLVAGHISKDCQRAHRCGVDGCRSDKHSQYLHESLPTGSEIPKQDLLADSPPYTQQQLSRPEEILGQCRQYLPDGASCHDH